MYHFWNQHQGKSPWKRKIEVDADEEELDVEEILDSRPQKGRLY